MKIKEKIKEFLIKNNSEILAIPGLFFIILASYFINSIVGTYVLGITLIILGIFVAIKPRK
ncbi:hypothetical protein [Clostridium senegalense]